MLGDFIIELLFVGIIASVSFCLGFKAGAECEAIDLDTFDAQARIIRDLTQQLAEEHPDDPRYHIDE